MADYQRKLPPLDPCPVEAVLEIIGGRWNVRILYEMLAGGVRLTDLRGALPRASQQVISQQLRHLCATGVVERVTGVQAGRRSVMYRLTEEGESLTPLLWAMAEWGLKRMDDRWTTLRSASRSRSTAGPEV